MVIDRELLSHSPTSVNRDAVVVKRRKTSNKWPSFYVVIQSHEKVVQPIFELLLCALCVRACRNQKMRKRNSFLSRNLFYVKCLPFSSPVNTFSGIRRAHQHINVTWTMNIIATYISFNEYNNNNNNTHTHEQAKACLIFQPVCGSRWPPLAAPANERFHSWNCEAQIYQNSFKP